MAKLERTSQVLYYPQDAEGKKKRERHRETSNLVKQFLTISLKIAFGSRG